ncbi:hypothetical protein [Sphingosinicella sp. BN140058]|uniref:hypothetical protein n=1 Tax=Sphingosinicella sp. BN140058 TaxID=1892855 RepID=UPI0010114A08|nr:hypothetical protein [Sphingosinicella sp. BN140058]QAY78974.1 hypothetical protein ETR14_22370 [Sphingosinicella sp. BN140058]
MACSLEALGRDHLLEQETFFRRLAIETPDDELREMILGMADAYANAATLAGEVKTIDPEVARRRRRHEAPVAH